MSRCLGDYPLCLVTKEVIIVQNFNHRRAFWYAVCRGRPVEVNLSNEHVEVDLSKVSLSNEHVQADLLKANLSVVGWIKLIKTHL